MGDALHRQNQGLTKKATKERIQTQSRFLTRTVDFSKLWYDRNSFDLDLEVVPWRATYTGWIVCSGDYGLQLIHAS